MTSATVPAPESLLATFGLAEEAYSLTQLRYDLRKMKAHGLLARDGRRYCYRLTDKGVRVAAMFVLFHKRVCGPLAHTLFQGRPDKSSPLRSPIETAGNVALTALHDGRRGVLDRRRRAVVRARRAIAHHPHRRRRGVLGLADRFAGARARIAQLADRIMNEWGGIDILVNCVGGSDAPNGGYAALTEEHWQSALNLNLMAAVRCLPTM